MAKLALLVIASLALAVGGASAGMDELRARLAQRFSLSNSGNFRRVGYGGYGQGGSAAASASAVAASNGVYGSAAQGQAYTGGNSYGSGGSYAAASAATRSNGLGSSGAMANAAAMNGGYNNNYASVPAPIRAPAPIPMPAPAIRRPMPYVSQQIPRQQPIYNQYGAGSQAAASAYAANYAAPAPVPPPTPAPVRVQPMPQPVVNRYMQPVAAYNGGSAAASSAVAGGAGGSAASAAAVANNGASMRQGEYNYSSNPAPNTYAAASGTFASNGRGSESSSYKRSTENIDNVEQGRADDNHYYNAQSYGRAADENQHEAFNDADEDVMHTPNMFRSSKKSVSYVNDRNKNVRESGSGVLAKDKHSSAFSKKFKRFNENVDQQHSKEANGVVENSNSATRENFGDEDEMSYDSDGLGTFQGVNGERPMPYQGYQGGAAGAASSVAGGAIGGSSVATSAAAGKGSAAAAAAVASGSANRRL